MINKVHILTFQKTVIIVLLATADASISAVMTEERNSGVKAVEKVVLDITTPDTGGLGPVLELLLGPT
jgi:hypothetical protein